MSELLIILISRIALYFLLAILKIDHHMVAFQISNTSKTKKVTFGSHPEGFGVYIQDDDEAIKITLGGENNEGASDGGGGGDAPPSAPVQRNPEALRQWMIDDIKSFLQKAKAFSLKTIGEKGDTGPVLREITEYALQIFLADLRVFVFNEKQEDWLRGVPVYVLEGETKATAQGVLDLRPDMTKPVTTASDTSNSYWYGPNTLMQPNVWEYNFFDTFDDDGYRPLYFKQVNPSQKSNLDRLLDSCQCVPSRILAHTANNLDVRTSQKLKNKAELPILQFTEEEYYHWWAPLNKPAYVLFETALNSLDDQLKSLDPTLYLERYPRVITRPQVYLQIPYPDDTETIIKSQLSCPAIIEMKGDFSLAANILDLPHANMAPPPSLYYAPPNVSKIEQVPPFSLYSLYGSTDVDKIKEKARIDGLLPIYRANPFINGAGIGNVRVLVNLQVFGSGTVLGSERNARTLKPLSFQQGTAPVVAPYLTYPKNKNVTYTASASKYSTATEYALRKFYASVQPTGSVARSFVPFLINGNVAPQSTSDNSSWLGNFLQPTGHALTLGSDFMEVTKKYSSDPTFLAYVNSTNLPYYIIDEDEPRLSVTTQYGGTVSWHPIISIHGDVTKLRISMDNVSVYGTSRTFGIDNVELYDFTRHYDLQGRKGLYDLCVILCWQYKLNNKRIPQIPAYMAHMFMNPYETDSRSSITALFDKLVDTSNYIARWGVWKEDPSLPMVAQFKLRHRLPDLQFMSVNGVANSQSVFLPIMGIDVQSHMWYTSAVEMLPSYAAYHKENDMSRYPSLQELANLGSSTVSPSNEQIDKALTAVWPVMVSSSLSREFCSENVNGICRFLGDWKMTTHDMRVRAATIMNFSTKRGVHCVKFPVYIPGSDTILDVSSITFLSCVNLVDDSNGQWSCIDADAQRNSARLEKAYSAIQGTSRSPVVSILDRLQKNPYKQAFQTAFIFLYKYVTQGLNSTDAKKVLNSLQAQLKAYINAESKTVSASNADALKSFVTTQRRNNLISRPGFGYQPSPQKTPISTLVSRAKAKGQYFVPTKNMLSLWLKAQATLYPELVDDSFVSTTTATTAGTPSLSNTPGQPPQVASGGLYETLYAAQRTVAATAINSTTITLQQNLLPGRDSSLLTRADYQQFIQDGLALLQLNIYDSAIFNLISGSQPGSNFVTLPISSLSYAAQTSTLTVTLAKTMGDTLMNLIKGITVTTSSTLADATCDASNNGLLAYVIVPNMIHLSKKASQSSPYYDQGNFAQAYENSWALHLTAPNSRVVRILTTSPNLSLEVRDVKEIVGNENLQVGDDLILYLATNPRSPSTNIAFKQMLTVSAVTSNTVTFAQALDSDASVQAQKLQNIQDSWRDGHFPVLMRGDALRKDANNETYVYAEISGGKVESAPVIDSALLSNGIRVKSGHVSTWIAAQKIRFYLLVSDPDSSQPQSFRCTGQTDSTDGNDEIQLSFPGLSLSEVTTIKNLLHTKIQAWKAWLGSSDPFSGPVPMTVYLMADYVPYGNKDLQLSCTSPCPGGDANQIYWRNFNDASSQIFETSAPQASWKSPLKYGLVPYCLNASLLNSLRLSATISRRSCIDSLEIGFQRAQTKKSFCYVWANVNGKPVAYQPVESAPCFGRDANGALMLSNSLVNAGSIALVMKLKLAAETSRFNDREFIGNAAEVIDIPAIEMISPSRAYEAGQFARITPFPSHPQTSNPPSPSDWTAPVILATVVVLIGLGLQLLSSKFDGSLVTYCTQNCRNGGDEVVELEANETVDENAAAAVATDAAPDAASSIAPVVRASPRFAQQTKASSAKIKTKYCSSAPLLPLAARSLGVSDIATTGKYESSYSVTTAENTFELFSTVQNKSHYIEIAQSRHKAFMETSSQTVSVAEGDCIEEVDEDLEDAFDETFGDGAGEFPGLSGGGVEVEIDVDVFGPAADFNPVSGINITEFNPLENPSVLEEVDAAGDIGADGIASVEETEQALEAVEELAEAEEVLAEAAETAEVLADIADVAEVLVLLL